MFYTLTHPYTYTHFPHSLGNYSTVLNKITFPRSPINYAIALCSYVKEKIAADEFKLVRETLLRL